MAWSTTSRQSRGYGRAWEIVREQVLRRDSYLCQCQHCKAENRTILATEVDHVVSKAKAQTLGWSRIRTDDPSNLSAINRDCHKRKTIEELGGKLRPRVTIGLDGFPVGVK